MYKPIIAKWQQLRLYETMREQVRNTRMTELNICAENIDLSFNILLDNQTQSFHEQKCSQQANSTNCSYPDEPVISFHRMLSGNNIVLTDQSEVSIPQSHVIHRFIINICQDLI